MHGGNREGDETQSLGQVVLWKCHKACVWTYWVMLPQCLPISLLCCTQCLLPCNVMGSDHVRKYEEDCLIHFHNICLCHHENQVLKGLHSSTHSILAVTLLTYSPQGCCQSAASRSDSVISAGHKLLSEPHDVRLLHVNVLKANIVLMSFTSTTNLTDVRGCC